MKSHSYTKNTVITHSYINYAELLEKADSLLKLLNNIAYIWIYKKFINEII